MEEFMTHLYGSKATQSLNGGNMEYANEVKLNSENIGRPIGKEQFIDKPEILNGGDYDPPKSFSSIIEEALMNMKGGKKRRQRKAKKSGGSVKEEPIASSLEYIGIGTKYEEDIKTFLETFMLYYRVSRSPSSAILVIPPKTELQKMKKAFEDYCKKTLKALPTSIEAENLLASNNEFSSWRNYLFYVYVKGENVQYRIDEYQNGGANAYPNDKSSVIEVVFKRANLNSYIWFMKYNEKDDKFYLYPNEDLKNSEAIGLEFIGMAKQGKYMFQADKPIPNNSTNKLDLSKQSVNQFLDRSTMSGGSVKKPIARLVKNWERYGLEGGSELSLCEMYKTAPSQVMENLSGNLVHSAILSAMDGIAPGVLLGGEIPEITKQMKDSWRFKAAPAKMLKLNNKMPIKEFYQNVRSQYPSTTRENIIKADMITALINGGMNPSLAFSALDYDTHGNSTKILTKALETKPFEYFNSSEHPPIFLSTDANGIKDIFDDEKPPEPIEQKAEEQEEKKDEKQNEKQEEKKEEKPKEEENLNGGEFSTTSDSEMEYSEHEYISEPSEPSEKEDEKQDEENDENNNEDDDNEPNIEGGKTKRRRYKLNRGVGKGKKNKPISFKSFY